MKTRSTSAVFLLGLIGLWPSIVEAQLQPPAQDYCLRFYYGTWWGGQYAKTDEDTVINLGSAFTLELWVYLEQATQGANLLGKPIEGEPPTGLANVRYALSLDYDTGLRPEFVQSADSATARMSVRADDPLPLNAWTHLAGVLNDGVMTLYVNGVMAASGSSPGPPASGIESFYVGGYPSSFAPARGVPGCLKQVRVWDRALTPAEIGTHAAKWLTGAESGLVASWPLNDGTGLAALEQASGINLVLGRSPYFNPFPVWVPVEVLQTGPYFAPHGPNVWTTPTPPEGFRTYGWGTIDFDHDGDPDVLKCHTDNGVYPPVLGTLEAYRNDGGVLVDVTEDVIIGCPQLMELKNGAVTMDFTGDGLDDVFLPCYGMHTEPHIPEQDRLLVGTSDGKLIDETATRLPAEPDPTHDRDAGDIDGDGDIDIVCAYAGNSPHPSRFYINDGTGHFTADETRIAGVGPGVFPGNAHLVDVDADGDLDLVYGVETAQAPRDVLQLNDGTGHFDYSPIPLPPRLLIDTYSITDRCFSADFNEDGHKDLLMHVWFPDGLDMLATYQLLMNNGDGSFRDATERLPYTWWHDEDRAEVASYYTYLADMNDDGLTDILFHGSLFSVDKLVLNMGGGYFWDAQPLLSFPNQPLYGVPLPMDYDKDGDQDFFTVGFDDYYFVENLKNYDILGADTDGDGLINEQETLDLDPVTPGVQNPFDPNVSDSTGDNFDPNPDGIPDGQNDWDGDGVSNATEFQWGSNPIDPNSTASLALAPWAWALAAALLGLAAAVELRTRTDWRASR